jgi:hypothetical protein
MTNWPRPRNIKQLRGFLGLTGFYRKFIKNYASIAHALTELLKKDSFLWSNAAQSAFDNLKRAMTNAPVLALPNFEADFMVDTDASGIGMGAVLSQNGHPIAFFSKKFCPKLLTASTYVRELCAITAAVKKWRTYLLGRKFVIHTDQRSLRELMTQVIQTPEQQFYLAKLLGYSYEIVYKPGNQNRVADALSRIHDSPQAFLAITIPHFEFLNKLKADLKDDPEFQSLVQKILQNPSLYDKFQVLDDLLFYQGKLYIPTQSRFKHMLLEEFHSSTIGGHSGIHKTLGRLRENVYWEGMHKDVNEFVKNCLVCQETKIPPHLPYGLLQPLPLPTAVWEDISLDFIIGLPSFQTYTVVLVVVDRFSKAAHFGMLPHNFTAHKVADLFADMVFKHHGMPKSIVSDRDAIFLSQFWQQLFKNCGTTLRMSSAYHPQSDGQIEIVNKALQQYLRCFVNAQPKAWGKFLHLAEWHYNTTTHASTGFSPFHVVFGKPPPAIPQYIAGSSRLEAVDTTLTTRDDILETLKKKLQKAQTAMKFYADKRRLQHPFKEGDLVLVKLRPYRQVSVSGTRIHKLAKRFFGPFKIVQQIGDVAFKLELPPSSKIHPVFHASQLKPFHGTIDASPALPPDSTTMPMPVAVLDWKTNGELPPQVLIQWSDAFPEDATWESLPDMQIAYPNLHLEDKVLLEGDRDVMYYEEEQGVNEEEIEAQISHEVEESIPQGRPQRAHLRPKWLNGYVTALSPKGIMKSPKRGGH